MADKRAPDGANLYLGKGVIYFDRFDANGVKTGLVHLGNCSSLDITGSGTVKEIFENMTKNAKMLASTVTDRKLAVKIVGTEFNADNLALVMQGTKANYANASNAAITAQALATGGVMQGRWYEVGRRNIAAVVVKVASVAKTITTDYLVDAVRGLIYIVPGGGIADAAAATVDCTSSDPSNLKQVTALDQPVKGKILFIGDPSAGPVRTVEMFQVSLTPDQAMALISQDYTSWGLTGTLEHTDQGTYREIFEN